MILGGGCAGLATALRLSEQTSQQVTVVEPRSRYTNDRTWSFWAPKSHPHADLVSAIWPEWEISADGQSHVAGSCSLMYQSVPADRYYRSAIETLEKRPNVALMLGTRALGVDETADCVTVALDDGSSLDADYVVDTRPIREESSMVWQSFFGKELRTQSKRFPLCRAGLMLDIETIDGGLEFVYLLPFASDHALVELTRFSSRPMSKQELRSKIDKKLSTYVGDDFTQVRDEYAALPMGLVLPPSPVSRRVCRLGRNSGGLRAATGYGFQRIQRAATCVAEQITRGEEMALPRYDGVMTKALDRIFLDVLRNQPDKAVVLFMSMARVLKADEFARFMSDQAGPWIWIKIILAAPKMPFITALFGQIHDRFWRRDAAVG